ncbi:hypothetical protein CAOG_03921 [Capsaspora owczarzaki ATCC 30864]|uniref:Kinetochore protein Sos7 coiled-coil domain-containing protein n=1 Tax=Capsaspora owczarzaki (strain ATCC 30864) TaxID=595528 RepID=A0A0D2WQB7_CAPO3|nr:hypothetical protein CAOG_03921 [Capsaspora owczarzaki ATCC 30864]KJE93078.1 hypothetical protein CAOG_003921 [Capsaspora owczarzaki ATCC 30864]|eukprot:XP_004363649.2 hypothetical protein CAOG_03921 [Capsaspora owczarzaki ATCC 30864]
MTTVDTLPLITAAVDELKRAKEPQYHFLDLQHALVGAEAEQTAAADVLVFKENLSKLKFNFIELETKSAFLMHVGQNTAFPSSTELAAEESKKSQAQAHYKNLKKQASQVRTEIAEIAKTIDREFTELQGKLAELAAVISELEQTQHESQQLISRQPQPMILEGRTVNANELEAIVQQQQELLGQLASEREMVAKQIADLQRAKHALESDPESVRQAAASGASGMDQAVEQAQLVEMQAWFVSMTAALAKLGGVELLDVQPQSMTIRILLNNSKTVDMFLQFSKRSSAVKLEAAQLMSSNTSVADLVEQAVILNDVPFLISELRHRLSR